jgi:hypothetical protein
MDPKRPRGVRLRRPRSLGAERHARCAQGRQAGVIAVSATPPIMNVDGKEDRFSPGVRIRDRNTMAQSR